MRLLRICLPLIVGSLMAAIASADQGVCSHKSSVTLKERFNNMDTNQDGLVSEEEFTAAHHERAVQMAHSIFKKMGGSELSLDQFIKARQAWEKKMAEHHKGWQPKTTAQKAFQKMDVNHDGKVSESEFVAYWVKQADDRAVETFAKMGGTKDKGLTFAQFQKAHEE